MKGLIYVLLSLFMLLQVLGYQCQKERIQNLEIETFDQKRIIENQDERIEELENQVSLMERNLTKLQKDFKDLPK